MSFDTFLQAAWNDHAQDSSSVAARLGEGIELLEKGAQVPALARLVVHVTGEHLGDWEQGFSLLERIRQSPHFAGDLDAEAALGRSAAILGLCRGDALPAGLSAGDRGRVLATAASSLTAHGQIERAEKFFREALSVVRALPKTDPAQRDLAVTCNNLAAALEEKKDRTFRESELMLIAAHASRKQWEIAGGWLEVMRAEYRLAMSFLAAGKPGDAHRHAELCRETGLANDAPAAELFSAEEAIVLSGHARGQEDAWRGGLAKAQELFEAIPAEERSWYEPAWKKLSELE